MVYFKLVTMAKEIDNNNAMNEFIFNLIKDV